MAENELFWDDAATRRLKKVPFFVRKLAKSKIEKAAREQGTSKITLALMDRIKKQEMG